MRNSRIVNLCAALALGAALPVVAHAQSEPSLNKAVEEAQAQLQQTFTNLQFEDFGPSPVKGPIYQASAGGRIVYYAPDSEHILFAAVYDRNGLNVTALAQDAAARRKLAGIDTSKALALGPVDAPTSPIPIAPIAARWTASGPRRQPKENLSTG